jgi:hypothetical protein
MMTFSHRAEMATSFDTRVFTRFGVQAAVAEAGSFALPGVRLDQLGGAAADHV